MSILALLGLAAAAPEATSAIVVRRYEQLTQVSVRCARPVDPAAIIVCGRRAADRWRVPLLGYDAGDPRGESVSGERNRLASEPRQDCGNTAFFGQARCGGMVGVSVAMSFGGGGMRWRPLAD